MKFSGWGGAGGSGGGIVQLAQVKSVAGDQTTNVAAFTDIPFLSISLTTGAHRCLLSCILNVFTNNGENMLIDFTIDGVPQGGADGVFAILGAAAVANVNWNVSGQFATNVLTAGTHLFKMKWSVPTPGTTGTLLSSGSTPAFFTVIETGLTT